MTYIRFWVHWLVEYAPKSGKHRFTKSGRLTPRDPKEGAKIILKLLFLTQRPILRRRPERTAKQRKTFSFI